MPQIFIPNHGLSRRSFLSRGLTAGLAAAGANQCFTNLSLVSRAMAETATDGYKALVCLFLDGGNDSSNLIIPTSSGDCLKFYHEHRGVLAIDSGEVIETKAKESQGFSLGLHPSCAALKTLQEGGQLATILNVGTLRQPGTNENFFPSQRFSHSDQIAQWQRGTCADLPTGWGGRTADIVNAAANAGATIPMSISLAGVNNFQVGSSVSQYHVSSSGVKQLSNLSAMQQRILDPSLSINLQRKVYGEIVTSAIQTAENLEALLPDAQESWGFTEGSLGAQLSMVTRLIQARGGSTTRQIFFCKLDGFDTHSDQIDTDGNNLKGNHAELLEELSTNMAAFYAVIEGLNLHNQVVTFTASDFSRTFEPNAADSSDHAWGGHHLVMGGSVVNTASNGGITVGSLPYIEGSPLYLDEGRFIPTISVDQYSATLAKWFGLSESDLAGIFPNLSLFASGSQAGFNYGTDLGFLS